MSSTAVDDMEGLLIALESSIITPAERDSRAGGEAVSLGSGKGEWLDWFDASIRLEGFPFAEEASVEMGILDGVGKVYEMFFVVCYDPNWCRGCCWDSIICL